VLAFGTECRDLASTRRRVFPPKSNRRTERAPLIGRLGYGEMRIKSGGTTVAYYVDGGFVQVADNVVAVLTNRAVPAKNLDPAAAESQLATALQRPGNSPELLEIRERAIAQARAQLRTARRARL
jgi:F-type H+-transporting ATPase subunit epsilon